MSEHKGAKVFNTIIVGHDLHEGGDLIVHPRRVDAADAHAAGGSRA